MTTVPTVPEYIALHEPAGTLAAAFTGAGGVAILARRTETAGGTPYYRPVMRGKLADVALLVEQLAEVQRRGQLGTMEPDPDATPGGRREPEPTERGRLSCGHDNDFPCPPEGCR